MFSSRSKVRSVRTFKDATGEICRMEFSSRSKVRSVRTMNWKGESNCFLKVFIPFKSPVSSHLKLGFETAEEFMFSSRSKVRSVRTLNVQVEHFRWDGFHPVQKSGQFAPRNYAKSKARDLYVFIPFKSPVSSHQFQGKVGV